jgi:hypothetical protein
VTLTAVQINRNGPRSDTRVSTHANATSAGSVEGNGSGARRGSFRAFFAATLLVLGGLAFFAVPALAVPPKPTILGTSNVSYTHAEAEADFHSDEYQYFFEVSTDGVNWIQRGPTYGANGGGQTIAKKELPDLTPGTHYFVRASNYHLAEVISSSNTVEMTTLAVDPPEVVSIANASSVSYTSVHAAGKIKRPANADPAFNTSCYFEYVTEEQFTNTGFEGAGQTECDGGPITAGGESDVAATIQNLAHNTTYHLRLRAVNGGGEQSKAAAATFTTLPVTPPKVLAISAPTEIGNSSVLLHGEVERPANPDPAFEINQCFFDLVTDEQFL